AIVARARGQAANERDSEPAERSVGERGRRCGLGKRERIERVAVVLDHQVDDPAAIAGGDGDQVHVLAVADEVADQLLEHDLDPVEGPRENPERLEVAQHRQAALLDRGGAVRQAGDELGLFGTLHSGGFHAIAAATASASVSTTGMISVSAVVSMISMTSAWGPNRTSLAP